MNLRIRSKGWPPMEKCRSIYESFFHLHSNETNFRTCFLYCSFVTFCVCYISLIICVVFLGPGGSLEEGRGMDSSQMHSLYGSHGNRANSTSSGSPPVSTPSSSGSMLVVPQPISAASKGHGAPPGVATNGTGRKYQCKMCPQVSLHILSFLW